MLSSFLPLSIAHAEESCPAVEPALQTAEKDALSFFLADAQNALTEAADGFGCRVVEPALLARYWLAQAMVWHLQEREDEAQAALGAAKVAEGSVFTEDLGDELRGLWEAAPIPRAETVRVKIRGLARGDGVRIDTIDMPEPVVVPGFHLIQVVRDGEVVFGRVAEVPPSGLEMVMDVRAPTPAPKADVPMNLPAVAGPLTVQGGSVRDAQGSPLDYHLDVVPLSMVASGGPPHWSTRRRNGRLQAVALGTAAVGTWTTYLFTWDLAVGQNLPSGQAAGLAGTGLAIAGTGLVWEAVLLAKRRKHRKRTVELANTTLGAP